MNYGHKMFVNYLLGYDRYPDVAKGLVNVYNNWSDPAFRNRAKWNFSNLPVVGDFWKYDDNQKYWKDYFKNRGVSWADVKYPTLMSGSGSAGRIFDTDPKSLLRLYE